MRIFYLVKKEFLETIRQKEMLFLMLIAPIIQIILLGYVVTTDIKNIPVEIINLSKNKETVNIINRINSSPLFDVIKISGQNEDPIEVFKKGKIKSIIIFRDQFKKHDLLNYPEIQILQDGVDSNSSQIAAGYFNGIIKNYLLTDIQKLGRSQLIVSRPNMKFNPELKSINYMGPGIVALLLTLITMFLTSISIVREKEQQTIDTLLISKLKPIEIFIGKAIPMGIVGMIDMIIGIFIVVLWFEIPIRGNLIYLFIASIIYLTAILSFALLISIAASSQQQSLFFSWFSMITFILMSGIFTPIDNIPTNLKWIADINPLRYLIKIIRELFLKGNGIEYFYKDLIILTVITIIITSISLFNFKRFISN